MNKSVRLLIGGFAAILIVSTAVFAVLTQHMNTETEKDIQEVAAQYIEGIAAEELYHFRSIAEIRFKQVDYIRSGMQRLGHLNDVDAVYRNLASFGELQELPTMALIDAEGNYDTVYGSPLKTIDNLPFVMGNLNSGLVATTGANNNDEQVILWCVPVEYPMKSGSASVGLICSRPMELFIEKMNLEADGTLAFFHLIRQDGSYVIRNSDSVGNTFFDKLSTYATGVHQPTEEIIARFQTAIANGENCSWIVDYSDEASGVIGRRSSMAFPLPDSDWYIVAILPYNTLGTMVEDMGTERTYAMFLGIGVIALVILAVFLLYLRMTQEQLHQLEEAKQRTDEALTEAEAANQGLLAARERTEAALAEAEEAREAAEEAREDAVAANKAKSEFLSNMSHDIRTPMNAIVGMTAIATDHMDDKERVRECLRKITLSGKQLLGLINDVLDMSKIESGKMTLNLEALSLRQTMETMCDIVRPQIKSNGQSFDIFISNIIAENVYCDSIRLNQVLLNFLSNAMKFTPEGGSIHIDLRQEPSPKGDGFVRTHVSVSDTGMGMTDEFKKKLFTAFEREDNRRVHKTQGTGLGLTITKYIVDAMGGTIDVDSAPGKGTTFHVTVDFERVTEPPAEMKLPGWRILLVDDNQDLCETAELSLRELGARPQSCTSGERAVEMVTEAHQKGEDFFAVLIDYRMDGMNGVETAINIRKAAGGSDIPISLISAYDWGDIEEDAKRADITGFIPKPLFKSTLYHGLIKYDKTADENEALYPEERAIDLTGMHILLAEDNDINAEIATMILEESGAAIDRAEDGKIASEMFAASAEGAYQVILMDLRMPHMNGFEATEAIRSMKRADAAAVPIIAMTADAFAEDAQKCLAAGMNAHLAKPIDIEALKKTLAKYL